jgi:diguanylate cyclase (GGDEF)-like protein
MAVAASLRTGSRPGDHLSRFGGEEFVLILPNTDHDRALAIAERLRRNIPRQVFRPDGVAMTISMGVATAPEDGATLDDLLGRADERLYSAKNDGRNNVHGRRGRFNTLEEVGAEA